MKLLHETDWLASTPVFYDLETAKVSTKIQSLLGSHQSQAFHPEGLYNFLDFGYSIFGQTPLQRVQFLKPASRLWRSEKGGLEVEQLPDPFDEYSDYFLSESDIIDLIRERVQAWEASLPADQELVLPLSGGFDSRLLLWCLRDPSRVRSYTYGVSSNQSQSTEVVHAQALAKRFGVRWEQIQLGDFHRYFDDWNAEFGISTHAHGMYHFEFYTKIREHLKGRLAFLSGIFGDVWAGSLPPRSIDSPMRLAEIGYTHGLRADPSKLRVSSRHELRERFWTDNRERLSDHRFQVVTTVRMKIMLISYLMRVPRLFDFEPWTPYLDIAVAMAMLNLPQKRRANRQWQRDFFAKEGLDLESQGLRSTRSNNLNFQAMRQIPLVPLDRDKLSAVVDPKYVDWVNRTAQLNTDPKLHVSLCSTPKLGGVLRWLRICPNTLNAYCAYLCLKPVESAIGQQLERS